MLEVRNLRIAYDRVVAVHALDLRVVEGEIVAIVGPNGAGKTSTMMAISGVVAPEAGQICFKGEDISRAPSHDIYRRGVVQVPEGRLIFSELTVRDNLLLGVHAHRAADRVESDLELVFELFPVLLERLNQRADTLSGRAGRGARRLQGGARFRHAGRVEPHLEIQEAEPRPGRDLRYDR